MQRMQGRWCGCGGAVWSPSNANPLALRRSSRYGSFSRAGCGTAPVGGAQGRPCCWDGDVLENCFSQAA